MNRRMNGRSSPRSAAHPGRSGAWWVAGAGLLIGLLAGLPAFGQTVPEVVRPRSDAPTLPPGAGSDQQLTTPRSENPLPRAQTTAPIPDNGVVVPPVPGLGSTPVIRPPATDDRSVIPAPGAPGGDRTVVPK